MSNTAKLNNCPKCGRPIPASAPQALCPKCVLLGAAQPTEAGVPPTGTSEIPSLERIGIAFPQLQIIELIGRGGMGFVFKARQPHLDRFVALKLLPDQLAADAQFAERFNREGRVLARLNHPNIVSVFDFGQTGGFYFLLMEYVDGVNLRQAMRTGRFSPAEALAIVPKICEALQYAHEQGILHRDIKPENILLDTRGRVKIADFGIAKLVGDDRSNVSLTRTGAALGTPHYMAPEQLEKPTDVDHRADIYSLGVVFYEMLTGELPLGRFAPPSARTPVNATVDEVVLRTLEKDRERRFQSAGEMKTQVEHLGDGGGAAAGTSGPARRLSRWAAWQTFGHRRGVLKWIFIGALMIGLGTILVVRQDKRVPAPVSGTPAESVPQITPQVTTAAPVPDDGPAMVQFTVTSVELRDDAGARWLSMDYIEQVRGEAVRTFRYDARVPGFTPTTRVEAFLTDMKDGFTAVHHQRAFWKLPPNLPIEAAESLRDLVAREWTRKSVVIRVDEERILFKTLIPDGGTLSVAVGAKAPGAKKPAPQAALGTLRLVAVRDYHHLALARVESIPAHPLHKLVARLQGPPIPDQVSRAAGLLSGPLVVPSVDAAEIEPAEGSILWGTNRAPFASAVSFECPGDYALQFVLPDENLAREAARQIAQSLQNPSRLVAGRTLVLFTVGEWQASVAARPFRPDLDKLCFFLHPGRSTAEVAETNSVHSAVVTIPPSHELSVAMRLVVNGVNKPEFSTVLSSGADAPGVYWINWQGLLKPQHPDGRVGKDWELLIHDVDGRELHRIPSPFGMGIEWHRRWLTENLTAQAGQRIRQTIFEKQFQTGDRGPTFALLEMVMRPQSVSHPEQ